MHDRLIMMLFGDVRIAEVRLKANREGERGVMTTMIETNDDR